MHVCMSVSTHVNATPTIRVCMHVCMYVYMYVCMYVITHVNATPTICVCMHLKRYICNCRNTYKKYVAVIHTETDVYQQHAHACTLAYVCIHVRIDNTYAYTYNIGNTYAYTHNRIGKQPILVVFPHSTYRRLQNQLQVCSS